MIRFDCDYLEGAHKNIIEALYKTNFEQTCGYAGDRYCEKARELIKKECETEDADVHFLVGGTQANTTVIAAALKPYQAVVSASSGHINIHESGAIEGTGHKVIALPEDNGKVNAADLKNIFRITGLLPRTSIWRSPQCFIYPSLLKRVRFIQKRSS